MPQIRLGSELTYDVRRSTVFLFKIAVASTPHQQIVSEQLSVNPSLNVEDFQGDVECNRIQRLVVEPCQLRIAYNAIVNVTPDIDRPMDVQELTAAQMPFEALTYTNPSRYCESDLLARFAFEEFGQMNRGFARVQAICDWVYSHLDYTPGSTIGTTTAADVLLQRTGVCRDYAHLAIALSRGIGIPARYVSGYAVGMQPPDYHGLMEAFLDSQWYLFDPTKRASTLGLVRIGVGRDAADTAFSTMMGDACLTNKNVWASFTDATPSNTGNSAVSVE